ncbi:hypothetical protein FRX31_034269 [Thalictrum thalictroides]|uniref:Uncharacterized protein n=1 Tax=Thalictrum thalictroides TaxID=46969 RepID=A0A7J6UU64_THATH|nr:hypothetical protein FRX31_034269 [Thalictrum thalictroides]
MSAIYLLFPPINRARSEIISLLLMDYSHVFCTSSEFFQLGIQELADLEKLESPVSIAEYGNKRC